jgi:hypothetical protein
MLLAALLLRVLLLLPLGLLLALLWLLEHYPPVAAAPG